MPSQKILAGTLFPSSGVSFPALPAGTVSWGFFGTGLGQNLISGGPALVVPAGCSAPTITSNSIIGVTGTAGSGYSTQIAQQTDRTIPWTMIIVGRGAGAATTNFLMGSSQRFIQVNQALPANSNLPTLVGGAGTVFPTTLTVPSTISPRMYAMSGAGQGLTATLFDVASGTSVTVTENVSNDSNAVDIFAGPNGGRPVTGLQPSANFWALVNGNAMNLTALQAIYPSIKGFLNNILNVGMA